MSDINAGLAVSFTAELDAFDQRMKQSGNLVDLTASNMDKAAQRAARSFLRLEGALDPLSQATQRYQRDVARVQLAVDKGAVSQERATQTLVRLREQYDRATANAGRFAAAQNTASRSGRSMGVAIQQAGYQVGDFAVQISSGTNPLRAFIQQGTQMVSMFGPWGAVIGAAGAVIGSLAIALMDTGKAANDAGTKADQAADRFDRLRKIMEDLRGTARLTQSALEASARGIVGLIQLDLDRAEQRVKELQQSIREQAQATPDLAGEMGTAGAAALGAQSLVGPSALGDLKKAQKEVSKLTIELLTAKAEAGDFGDRFSVNAKQAAEALAYIEEKETKARKAAADAAKQHADSVRDSFVALNQEYLQLRDLVPLYEDGSITLDELALRRKIANELQRLGIDADSDEGKAIAELIRMTDQLNDRIGARTKAEQDSAKAAKKAADDRRKAFEKEQQEAQRQLEQFGERSKSILADTLLKQWTSDTFDFWDTFKTIGLSALANFVAEVATQKLILPVYAQIVGSPTGGSGLAGGQVPGGSLTNLPGGNLLNGVTGALDRFGASTGIFGSGVAPSTQLGTLPAVIHGGPGAVNAATQTGLLGSTSLSSFLGGAGAGAGAGMFLNSLVGGNQTGGMLGSAGGALAGAAIGSIVPGVGTVLGGLIGGSGGGLLGGLFGGGNKPTVGPNSTASGTLYGGLVALGSSGADNGGSIQRSTGLLTQLAKALDQVATATGKDIGAQQARISVMEQSGKITVEAAGQVGTFTDETQAVLFGVKALAGNMAGLDGEMERVIRQSSSLEAALADLAKIVEIRNLPTFFRQQTQLEQQVGELTRKYDDLTAAAERLNLAESERQHILEAQAAELSYLRGTFEKDIGRQLLAITNSGSAALADLQDELGQTLASAAAVGADLVQVEKLYGAKRLQAVQQFSDAQLRALSGGTQLDRSLAAYESARRKIETALDDIEGPFNDFIAAATRFRDDLQGLINSLLLDQSVSPLSPVERFRQAQAALYGDIAGARGNDVQALGRVADDLRAFLQENASFYGSTVAGARNFNQALAAARTLGIDLQGPISVQQSQLDRLTEIRDLLANPTGVDINALQAALAAVGISANLAPLVANLSQTQASAQREISHANRDALQEQYSQLLQAARAGDAQAAASWVNVAQQLADSGGLTRAGINKDAADVRERGFSVPSFATGGYHMGGLRLVGEGGPELEVTGPSRIFSAGDTGKLTALASAGQEIAMLRSDSRVIGSRTAALLASLVERGDRQAVALERMQGELKTLVKLYGEAA